MIILTDRIAIRVDSRDAFNDRLEAAVQNRQEAAMQEMTHGILITRHELDHYTAKPSYGVPLRNDPRTVSLTTLQPNGGKQGRD